MYLATVDCATSNPSLMALDGSSQLPHRVIRDRYAGRAAWFKSVRFTCTKEDLNLLSSFGMPRLDRWMCGRGARACAAAFTRLTSDWLWIAKHNAASLSGSQGHLVELADHSARTRGSGHRPLVEGFSCTLSMDGKRHRVAAFDEREPAEAADRLSPLRL
jgi:hypothetical protein